MSWLSKAMGIDSKRNKLNDARRGLDQELDYERSGGGFQQAFDDTAGAFLSSAMPQFRNDLQLTREDGQRRGIGTGDLGTSFEGDLTSAFQRNLSNTLGGLASSGYENRRNRILDIISGKVGSAQDELDSTQNLWGGIGGGLLSLGGSYLGGRGGSRGGKKGD